ncbi:MAG: PopZ family protein [Hyphomicrobiales bacterium]
MSSTEQAQEPTMEEILASIRKIISDDTAEAEEGADDAAPAAQDNVVEEDFQADAEPDRGDTDVLFDETETDSGDDDVLELTDVVAETAEEPADDVMFDEGFADSEMTDEASPGDDLEFVDVVEQPEPDPEPVQAEDTPEPAKPEDRLISDATDSAVATAFGQLASTLLTRSGNTRTLEELVQEMLRPMLKSWLDTNLPRIVEELVRQEIERAARKAGR